ncbi:MAG: class I SAM-dependent methyltransferase [Candidatus Binatia bacterium]
MARHRLFRRGPGTLYRRWESLRFLAGRDRRAVLAFLRGGPAGTVPLATRWQLLRQFVRITNRVRAYHTQAEMLAVAAAILQCRGQAGLTVVECGAGKGASTAKLSLATKLAGGRLLVFDSFRGLRPVASSTRISRAAAWCFAPPPSPAGCARCSAPSAFGAPQVVEYRKGWFADTLPAFDEPVDVALLDVDLLASTRTCLVHLAPRLRPGGVIFTQDGHLRAVAGLLTDPAFWIDEVGVAPPRIDGAGREKFLAIRLEPGPVGAGL